ncbi:hypothetical protein XENORESO_004927, partial [Xenotaenia resolanae]
PSSHLSPDTSGSFPLCSPPPPLLPLPISTQFPSPYPVVHMPAPFSPVSLPSTYSSDAAMSASYYSPSPHLPSLPLTPHTALTSVPSLGTPQTPLSTPQNMSSLALPFPHLIIANSPVMPQQQGGTSTFQHHTSSLHSTHPLTFSQVQPTPFPAPHPEQELADQPVQVSAPHGTLGDVQLLETVPPVPRVSSGCSSTSDSDTSSKNTANYGLSPTSSTTPAQAAAPAITSVLQPVGIHTTVPVSECASLATAQQHIETSSVHGSFQQETCVEDVLRDRAISLSSYTYDSLNSDVASGRETSDGYESLASGSKGDMKPRKHHRKSARTRSRQERTSKPKLSMLNVCNTGDKMVECQLETHNHKMVTFKFDLDGDAPEEIATYMVENGFILPLEKEIFIDQLKDIMDKAEDMLHEDMGDEKDTTLSCSPLQGQMSEVGEGQQPGAPQPVYQQNGSITFLHTGKRWFIICPVEETPPCVQDTPSDGTATQSPGSSANTQPADSTTARPSRGD